MNKYGPKARQEISKTMHEFSLGRLKSGRADKAVTNRDQAMAIGISKARKKHYKAPKIP